VTKKKTAKKKVSKKPALVPTEVEMVPKEAFDRLSNIHQEMVASILEHYEALTRLMVHSITSIETMREILKPPEVPDAKPGPSLPIGKGYPGVAKTPPGS
jgi:hypothetical protein